MVCLVSCILPHTVMGKGHAQIDKMEKSPCGQSRLHKSGVSVHCAPVKQSLRHLADTVRFTGAACQLIVSLFVRSCVEGSSHTLSLCDNSNIPLSLPQKRDSGIQAGCPAPHNQCIHRTERKFHACSTDHRIPHSASSFMKSLSFLAKV